MNQQEFESVLHDALERTERHVAERPDFQPLVSIQRQLEYLLKFNAGQADASRLKDIILGIQAVREIEGWDDGLADLLHKISAEVRVLIKAEELRRA